MADKPNNEWLVDSGSSAMVTPRRDWISNFQPDDRTVRTASGEEMHTAGTGDIKKDDSMQFGVEGVLYIPGLSDNMLSVAKMVKRGKVIMFSDNGCDIYRKAEITVKGKPIYNCPEKNGVYKLPNEPESPKPSGSGIKEDEPSTSKGTNDSEDTTFSFKE